MNRYDDADIQAIHQYCEPGLTAGHISKIEYVCDDEGDVVNVLGPDGLAILGFGTSRNKFHVVDERGCLLAEAASVAQLLGSLSR